MKDLRSMAKDLHKQQEKMHKEAERNNNLLEHRIIHANEITSDNYRSSIKESIAYQKLLQEFLEAYYNPQFL